MMKLAIFVLISVASVRSFEDMSVYQYLVTHNFGNFADLLRESGQATVLNSIGPFTVMAPTDAAIASMDPDFMSLLTNNRLLQNQFVKYHILKGYILTPSLHQGSLLTTVEGQSIVVGRDQQGSVVFNNDTHIAGNSDVICNNGVVQSIDKVLYPPVMGHHNIMQELVLKDKIINEFTMAVLLTNLTDLMKTSELTVFAPSDVAWGKHYHGILHPSIHLNNRPEVFYEMLKYHIVPGSRSSSMFYDGEKLFTVHGTPLNITIGANGDMRVNNYAKITDPDLPATNGMIHVIDDLLFPLDLFMKLREEYNQHHNITTPSG